MARVEGSEALKPALAPSTHCRAWSSHLRHDCESRTCRIGSSFSEPIVTVIKELSPHFRLAECAKQ